MNLSALPDQRAAENPLGPAVADDKTDLDNAQFLAAVQRAAASLRGHGVSAGDVVAIMLPNTASFVVSMFAAWRLGAAVTPINPSLRPAEVTYQVSDAGAKVLIVEKTPGVRRGCAGSRDRPARQRRANDRRRRASRRRRRAGPADLHQRNDRSAEGRDARSRQPRCDVQRGDRRVQADRCRSQPADTAAVPRQRNRRRNALTAAGRGQGDRGGPVQAGVVLRPDRAEPPHVLLRSTNHLHDAVRAARQREAGHLVGALRHLRGGAGQRRTAGGVRIPLRHPDHRGVRVVGGILRQHGQSAGRRAQARHGGTTRAGSDDPHRRHGGPSRCPTASPARL